MPEAEPFTFIGVIETDDDGALVEDPTGALLTGFPFFPLKVNLLDDSGGFGTGTPYDYWATLGGYNKTAADSGTAVTPEQIALSLRNAVRLFWNLYGVSGSRSTPQGSGTDEANADNNLVEGKAQPVDRICGVENDNDGLSYGALLEYDPLIDNNRVEISSQLYGPSQVNETFLPIVRMYNGVTTNEDNFVGYGVSGVKFGGGVNLEDGIGGINYMLNDPVDLERAFIAINLASYGNAPLYNAEQQYIQFEGIDFLLNISASTTNLEGTTSIDTANLTATVTITGTSDSDGTYTLTLNSLEFYTYPTS